jgi:APA family basic amino acid/polyamine antiporter
VLVYYAIANASAWTLTRDEYRPPRIVPVVGLFGCLVRTFTLPGAPVLAGSAVLALGTAIWIVRRTISTSG